MRICANSIDQCKGPGSRGPNPSRAKNALVICLLWVISGHTDKVRAISALPPITDVGRHVQVSM